MEESKSSTAATTVDVTAATMSFGAIAVSAKQEKDALIKEHEQTDVAHVNQ